LFDPGGDSATPTSRAAMATIFAPTLPLAGTAPAPATPVAPGAMAPCSIEANWFEPPAAPPDAGAAGVVGAGAATGGDNAAFSSLMRAMTVWRLTTNCIDKAVMGL
jgi:hypothetical protein